MTRPVLVVVDDDSDVLAALQAALARRYGADYQILAERSPDAALQTLVRLRQDDMAVAVIIADQWMPHMTGLDLLAQARQLHPAARRLLLVGVWDRSTNQPLSQAMSLGRLDGWVLKPWEPAEEHLYLPVTEQLTKWIRATGQPGFVAIQIVGQQWTPRSHEIRDLLDRNAIPYQFLPHDSEAGQQLLREHGQDGARLPVLVLFDGRVLVDPTNAEGAAAIGIATRPEAARYDLVVVGAGPAGLSAATYGVSEGLRTLMVEPEARGGQAASSSLIRNYLGFPYGGQWPQPWPASLRAGDPVWGGAGLRPRGRAASGWAGPRGHAGRRQPRGRPRGVGGHRRRLPPAAGARRGGAAGGWVFYGAAVSEARAMAGSRVFVVGAGNSAGQAALHLAKYAEQVTPLVRGDSVSRGMSDYLVKELQANDAIAVRLGTQVISAGGAGRLEQLTLHDARTGASETVPAAALFILIGAQPRTEWLAETLERDAHGFVLTGPDLYQRGQPPPAWPLDRPPGCWRPACRGCSPPATCATGRSSGWPLQWGGLHRRPARPRLPRRAATRHQDFDLMFLELMSAHHQGAIQMANAELRSSSLPEVKRLAQQIVDNQQVEIDQFEQWRKEWTPAPIR
jgi:thioredoxin reductase (NADPH)